MSQEYNMCSFSSHISSIPLNMILLRQVSSTHSKAMRISCHTRPFHHAFISTFTDVKPGLNDILVGYPYMNSKFY